MKQDILQQVLQHRRVTMAALAKQVRDMLGGDARRQPRAEPCSALLNRWGACLRHCSTFRSLRAKCAPPASLLLNEKAATRARRFGAQVHRALVAVFASCNARRASAPRSRPR
jgi:hypothetical protein